MKHVMSLSYQPKIRAVFSGVCKQTIRRGNRFRVGDEILLHTWTGKPYRSPWGERLRVVVTRVDVISVEENGYRCDGGRSWVGWDSVIADMVAGRDGIASGVELRDVLKRLNNIKYFDGQTFQIICWETIEEASP